MEKIECKLINECMYREKLDNGMEIIVVPKKGIKSKYAIWSTHYGSIDNEFEVPTTKERISVPDGVAHYLEHKMFENEDGHDSLYKLMALGIEANAYTTSDHTAYLFECTKNFNEGLDELMDYVQHPYFTKETVEKEQGIIGQEIMMYDDEPIWRCYLNAMKCLYKNNPIRIDAAGTVESISHITPEILYNCYNTFYKPSNMVFVVCGDFEPEEVSNEIKKRLLDFKDEGEIKRYYPEEPEEIFKKEQIDKMEISIPLFMIGIKDRVDIKDDELIKKSIAIQIILEYLLGKSSDLYNELYEEGLITGGFDIDYETSNIYKHVLISGHSVNPKEIKVRFDKKVEEFKNNEISEKDFARIKKNLYGSFVSEFNSVSDIARNVLTNWMKNVKNVYKYIEIFDEINISYIMKVLNEVFEEKKEIISIIDKNDK